MPSQHSRWPCLLRSHAPALGQGNPSPAACDQPYAIDPTLYPQVQHQVIHTRVALVQRGVEHRIIVRFTEGHIITAQDLAEIFAARRTLAAGQPMQVLALIPEDLDFDNSIILTDHYRDHDPTPHTTAMALVYSGTLFAQLFHIYLKLRKAPFPVQMFRTEQAADLWLEEQSGRALR